MQNIHINALEFPVQTPRRCGLHVSNNTFFHRGGTLQATLYSRHGRFDTGQLPADASAWGLPAGAGGLFLGFVPPHAAFAQVADELRHVVGKTATHSTFVGLSCTDALCSTEGSVYGDAQVQERAGSFIWLSDALLAHVEVFRVDLKGGQGEGLQQRVKHIGRELEQVVPSFAIDARDCFALVFCDGLSASEGLLMRAWYESKRFPCLAIGGSASGRLDFSGAYLHDGQQTLEGHALLIFCKVRPGIRFSAFKTQNFAPTGHSWRVAEADPMARTVRRVFTEDGRSVPLAGALAAHFGCADADLERQLATHTFAVSVGDEMYIRSVAQLGPEVTRFFCDIESGDRLALMARTDFIATTQRDWAQFLSGKGQPLAMLLNDCVRRRIDNADLLAQANFFSGTPAAGFSTFGEFLGIPMNQTLTALVFFRDDPGYSDPFMNAFPVLYAAYAMHYTQRALERWVALSDLHQCDGSQAHAVQPVDGGDTALQAMVEAGENTQQPLPEHHAHAMDAAARGFSQLVDLLLEKERELEAGCQHLHLLAHHDPLTGLPNRALLEERLQHALAQAQRSGREVALLFCDLDGFKQINDSHGHEIGDRLLCAVALRLGAGRRRIDTVARLGGDEFVILLGDLAEGYEGGHKVARQCLDALAEPFDMDGLRLRVGLSIGIAVCRDGCTDASLLLSQADSAMYEAKRAGKGRYAFFVD